jgi:hypothetical protein
MLVVGLARIAQNQPMISPSKLIVAPVVLSRGTVVSGHKVDRSQLPPGEIEKLEGAMKAASDAK